ncbi:hypothetical protein [Streptomyces sp. YU58]|uniref:hypothetical protein n=1 Tax=Streptomyces sp. SX92 TaxID=3158972 RepID=UPI0027B8C681|nr:hypothetical protein [Streptomyces coralus]WLW53581.1 hypothetical protein QU709_20370 [Streptomyces coralus]
MRAAHRMAALAGSAVLVATGVSALAAAPAAAAGKCVGGYSIVPKDGWGKVAYSVCQDGNSKGVQGRLTDLKSDGCSVKVEFKHIRDGEDGYRSANTGTTTAIGLVYIYGTESIKVNLSRDC